MKITKQGSLFPLDFIPEVNCLPLSVIITTFKRENVKRPLEGFGVLVLSKEQQNGLRTLGTLFSSMMFPDRTPSDVYLYTTFVGGSRNQELAKASSDELKQVVTSDLRQLLGAEGEPAFLNHYYWSKAFPLYGLSYGSVIQAIDKMEKDLPGFFYAGNHKGGLSVGKSISTGCEAADLVWTLKRICDEEIFLRRANCWMKRDMMACSILRLRAAAGGCRQFASSAVGLMLPSNKMYSLGEKKVVNIMNSSSSGDIEKELESDWVMGSSHGWVGLVKEERERVRCGSRSSASLWNPMSGSRVKLPPIHTMRGCRAPNGGLMVERLMVDDGECSRAVVVGVALWLGVCWPGRCSEWTEFAVERHCMDVALACSQSRVYTLDHGWELERWDVSDPRRPRREWKRDVRELGYDDDDDKTFPSKPDRLCSSTFRHLVYAEHSGQLFLLTRHYAVGMVLNKRDHWNAGIIPDKTVAFDVHLLVENGKLGKVNAMRYMEHSLDGLVMFVGINNSLAVPAADFPHLNPDSIYFTDHPDAMPLSSPRRVHDSIYGGEDVGIYDYKNRTISSCYYPLHHEALKRIHPFPFWLTG